MEKIRPEEFRQLADYVADITGIAFDQSKSFLIESRLGPLAAELGCANYQEFYSKIKSNRHPRLVNQVIDAITVNETYFFRDQTPFNLLRHKIIPDKIDQKSAGASKLGNDLNIWSAACSTGQEVYSIAILLRELLGDVFKWRIRILGTDVSEAAVMAASRGRYNQAEIERGLTAIQRQKYFKQTGESWQVTDEIRAMVSFRQLNLLKPFKGLSTFDIILCRNVAVYFDKENRKLVFDRIANQLSANGALLIGSTESLFGISDRFQRREYLNSVFYEKQY